MVKPGQWIAWIAGLLLGMLLAACATTAPPPSVPTRPAAEDTAAPTAAAVPTRADETSPQNQVAALAPLDVPELDANNAAHIAVPAPLETTPLPDDPVRIEIAAIELDRPLFGVGLDQNYIPIVPKHDVGWYWYSAQPGQNDNVVLWGHVLRFTDAPDIPAPFARLHELSPGATITLYNANNEVFTYEVTEQVWATPEEVDYILPKGSEQLTLVSCIGDKVIVDGTTRMSHRLITIAEPQS